MRGNIGKAMRLDFIPDRFIEAERPLTYEMVNSLLLTTIELQRAFQMRPLEFQIFMVVAMASVQRFMREARPDPGYLDATPLPPEHRGTISRRRIAETLDLPFETVRRHVAQLIARGALVESGRGLLSTGGGTLRQASEAGTTRSMAQRYLSVANRMIQLEVAQASAAPMPARET